MARRAWRRLQAGTHMAHDRRNAGSACLRLRLQVDAEDAGIRRPQIGALTRALQRRGPARRGAWGRAAGVAMRSQCPGQLVGRRSLRCRQDGIEPLTLPHLDRGTPAGRRQHRETDQRGPYDRAGSWGVFRGHGFKCANGMGRAPTAHAPAGTGPADGCSTAPACRTHAPDGFPPCAAPAARAPGRSACSACPRPPAAPPASRAG